ncbi:hypothetical protein MY4824_004890 [Beauveria thailandica]
MSSSRTSEESDTQTLLSQDTVELALAEKAPQYRPASHQFLRLASRLSPKYIAGVTVAVMVVGLAVATLVVEALSWRPQYSTDGFNISTNHCGATAEEALALGCKFDAINYAWQPADCFHEEVYNRYWAMSKEQGALKWYADSGFTKELPQDIDVLMHTPYVWSEHRLHVVHCLYDWELMHYALTRNKLVPEFISHLNHTMHCADTALDQNYRIQDTSIKASHNACVRLV